MGTMAQEPHTGYTRAMESFVLPTASIGAVPCSTRTRSPETLRPCGPASLPGPPDSELPAHTCTVYRPWFSPYSYFMCTKGAAQKQLGSLSSILASSTQEHEEPDDLSEIICSSSGSSDELQPTERDRPARNRASITFRDILAASQWQPVPQRGYQCVSCCRVFPTLWSVKDHIQHSSQEGYSCKVYYRKLKALWEKEHKEQEAAAPRVPV
ncbi:spermatogenesis-associated protein 46 [Buteo buteo]|uniref:spermatogenesis-associated protein 46 n=1 Tax=Buteo buteo TaxID=30397 RepID=UPI003EBEF55C